MIEILIALLIGTFTSDLDNNHLPNQQTQSIVDEEKTGPGDNAQIPPKK